MVAGQQMQKGAAPAFSDFPPITENYVPNEIGVVVNGARKQTVPEYLGFLSNQHQNESDLKKKGEIEGKMTSILKYFVSDQVEEASFHEYAAQCVNVLAESGLARKVLDPLLFDTVNEERLGMLYEMCIRVEAFNTEERPSKNVPAEGISGEKMPLSSLLSSRRAATDDGEKMRIDLEIAKVYGDRLQKSLNGILKTTAHAETKISQLAELYEKEQKLFAGYGLANSAVATYSRQKIHLMALYQIDDRLKGFNSVQADFKSIDRFLSRVKNQKAWALMGISKLAKTYANNLNFAVSASASSKKGKYTNNWEALSADMRKKSGIKKAYAVREAEPYVQALWESTLKKKQNGAASTGETGGMGASEKPFEPFVINDFAANASKPSDKPAPPSASKNPAYSAKLPEEVSGGESFDYTSDVSKYDSKMLEQGMKNQEFVTHVMARVGAVGFIKAFKAERGSPQAQQEILKTFISAYRPGEVFRSLRTEAALSDVGAFGDFASSVFSGQDEKAKTKLFGANGKGELSLEQLMARFSEMGIEARQDFLSKKGLLREFTKGHKFSLNGETSSINVSELGFELVSNQGGSMQSVAANMSNFNFTDSNGTIVQMPQEMKEGVALATMVHVMEYMRTAEYTTSDMIVRMEWSEPLKQPADIFVSEVVRSINERDFDALRKTLSESGFAVQAKARAAQGWKPSDIENFASQVATEMPKDAGLAAIEKTVDELSEEIAEERSKA